MSKSIEERIQDKKISRAIAEWLHRDDPTFHWHEFRTVMIGCSLTECTVCGKNPNEVKGNPVYTESLDAVRPAEERAVEEFGAVEYFDTLMAVVLPGKNTASIEELVKLLLATAEQRALAVYALIMEKEQGK